MYDRMIAPLDGSALAERVLPHVVSLAETYGATVTLLRATTSPVAILSAEAAVAAAAPVPPPIIDPEPIVAAERHEAVAYLESVGGRLRGRGIKVDLALPQGDPAEAIVEYAREHDADLIAMTTHGRSGLGRALMGSVADSVVRTAPCPVLLVRVPEEDES